jgi:rhodanese-related sulfurtransferase
MNPEQLIEFVTNHWILTLAFVTILGLLVGNEFRLRVSGVGQLGPTQAIQMLNHNNAVFLDVQNDSEFGTGHLANARHIPLEMLKDRAREIDKLKNKPVITYCRNGQRSKRASSILKSLGFEQVYNLAGGITAWESAGLPTRKS